jgi:hypothetical protein
MEEKQSIIEQQPSIGNKQGLYIDCINAVILAVIVTVIWPWILIYQ